MTIKNLITNIVSGQSDGKNTGWELARKKADEHQKKTGNTCIVQRVLDYTDQFNGRDREHYSFDVIEIIKD